MGNEIFMGKVSSLPKIGAPERCFTQVGSGLGYKHSISLEMLAMNKIFKLIININILCP
jgi:hypothetical protein